MKSRLTLKIDKKIVDFAKQYAKENHTSLSLLTENYLKLLIQKGDAGHGITPLVKSLSGILELPEYYNHKKEYTEFLISKYR